MISVARQYKKAFQPVFAEYGFQSYKNAFYRVINDVVQVFCLHRYRDGMCEFFFDIESVSLGLSELDTMTYNIALLRDAPFECRDWYPAELIDTNFSEVIQLTQKYVLPFFEKGIDAGSAYQVIRDHEQQIYGREAILFSGVKFLFCLQAKNYTQAAKYMEDLANHNIEAIREHMTWKEGYFGPLSREEKEVEEAKILRNQQKLEKVRNWDADYWDEVLKTGTAKTMSFLSTIQSGKGSKSRRKGTV